MIGYHHVDITRGGARLNLAQPCWSHKLGCQPTNTICGETANTRHSLLSLHRLTLALHHPLSLCHHLYIPWLLDMIDCSQESMDPTLWGVVIHASLLVRSARHSWSCWDCGAVAHEQSISHPSSPPMMRNQCPCTTAEPSYLAKTKPMVRFGCCVAPSSALRSQV